MNKANIGWWEADLKAETYQCSELISQLLGIGEDGLISFEDFNKRILKEDQGYATFPSFDKVQQTVEEIYLFDTPKVMYGFVARHASRKQTKMVTPKYMELPKPKREFR